MSHCMRGQPTRQLDVRDGSLADIETLQINVRLYPHKRTSELNRVMSALCQKQTLAALRLSEKTPSPLAKRFRRTRVKIDTIVERYRINTN
jgi:hypothetical protein